MKNSNRYVRPHRELPIMYHIVVQDWIPTIGNEAFVFWLKLHTLGDTEVEADDIMDNNKEELKILMEYGLVEADGEDFIVNECPYGIMENMVLPLKDRKLK